MGTTTGIAEYRVRPRFSGTFGPWTYADGPFLLTEFALSKTSISTPNFRRLKRRQLPDHPHSWSEWRTVNDYVTGRLSFNYSDGSSATNEYRGPAQWYGIDSRFFGDIAPADGPINSKALHRLFDDLSLTAGSAGVSGAELPKTLQLIGDTAIRLGKAYRALKRGKVNEFTEAIGITISSRRANALRSRWRRQATEGNVTAFAANTWLEFTYGWKPLISDLYAQLENTANHLVEKQNVVRVGKGTAKERRATTKRTQNVGLWKTQTDTVVTVRFNYTVKYKLRGGPLSFVSTFGINNPALIAWEVVPFSFVVDWFLPIGTFLEELTATSGLEFHSGTRSRLMTATCFSHGEPMPPVPTAGAPGVQSWAFTSSASADNKIRAVKQRDVLSSFPSVQLPEFKNPLSLSHAISGIALLYSAFHGGVKSYVSH
jgi:hypothetical protein